MFFKTSVVLLILKQNYQKILLRFSPGNRTWCNFDVRVFNPNAQTHRNLQLASVYRKQEREKQRTYEQRIREVELGTFTPLVFSTSGGMAKSASVAYKRLASLLARKRDQPYSLVIAWLRCHLSFSLLRSAITCL